MNHSCVVVSMNWEKHLHGEALANSICVSSYARMTSSFSEVPWVLSRKQMKEETYARAKLEIGGIVQQTIKCIKVDLLIYFYC